MIGDRLDNDIYKIEQNIPAKEIGKMPEREKKWD